MILTSLYSYYKRLENTEKVPTFGYSRENISFVIILSPKGEAVAMEDYRIQAKSKLIPNPLNVPATVVRTRGIKPNFLWDNTAYVFAVTDKEDGKAAERHQSFKDVHFDFLKDTQETGLIALKTFLENWSPNRFDHLCSDNNFDPKEVRDKNIIFQLDGQQEFIHESNAAKKLIKLNASSKKNMNKGICLVTGKHSNIPKIHPKIKGVKGGQTSGTSIVSFNEDAFCSYGKEQNLNAPVSEEATAAYTSILNYLLRKGEDNRQKILIGDTTVVFWAESQGKKEIIREEEIFGSFLNSPPTDEQEGQELREIMQQIAKGRPIKKINPELDENTKFYILGLAPNASRLSIRFWQANTFQLFTKRFLDHFRSLEIDPLPWMTPPSVYRLSYAIAPYRGDKQKIEDIPPNLIGELLRSILTGRNYPCSLLSNILMRFRNDGYITGIRVALCKAVLIRNEKEKISMSLDEKCKDPAYLLGRLFAELENAQKTALGKEINATIKDRYYATASSSPALVFPTLLRGCMHHLSKAKKDDKKKSAGFGIEKKIGEILSCYNKTEYPKTLSLIQQGKFSIGYYHQANDWKKNLNKGKGEEHEYN